MINSQQFKIKTTSDKGSFKVVDSTQRTIELVYERFVGGDARSTYSNICIKPKNIWKTEIYFYKEDKKIGQIISNSGAVTIKIENSNNKILEYHLGYSRTKLLKLDVFNNQNELQFSMIEDINNNVFCNKITRDYKILMAKYDFEIDIIELLIYCGYAARWYLSITNCNYYFAQSLKSKS